MAVDPTACLEIPLRPSRLLPTFILVLHVAGGAGLVAAGLSVLEFSVGFSVLLVSIVVGRCKHCSPTSLTLLRDGSIQISYRDDGPWVGQLGGDTLLLGPVVLLQLISLTGRGSSLVVLPDMLDEEPFRQLRMWLRWRSNFEWS